MTCNLPVPNYLGRSMCGLAAVALLTTAQPGIAQETTSVLTVDAAVRIALDRNPRVRAAAEGVQVAAETVGEARAPFYPALTASAGYSRWETHAFLPSGLGGSSVPSTVGPTDDWAANLSGSYTLYDGGKRAADLRFALASRGAAEQDLARVRHDLAFEVRRAFYALLAARDGEHVAAASLARAEEHLRLATGLRAAGAVPGGDVVQAQVRVAEARLSRVRAESIARQARGALNLAMGLPVETVLDVVRPQRVPAGPPGIDISAALTEVPARPLIQAAIKRAVAASEAEAAARTSFGPRIAGHFSFGVRDDRFIPGDRDWRAGVSVTWSLFDGFEKKHRLGRARAERSRAEAEVERATQRVREEVWAAHARLLEAYEAVQAATALIRDAEEGERIARERYRVGAGTINDLLDAEAALARAAGVRGQAEWDYRTADAALDWAIGRAVDPEPAGGGA